MARYAYADPPYPGQARKHYKNDPSGIEAREVDHAALIDMLCREFPDGWALSTSQPALKQVLDLCPPDVRVCAWVKTWVSFKPGRNPGDCWEPVILWRGRQPRRRDEPTVRDWLACPVTTRQGTHGAKPEPFNLWILELLGALPGDIVHDVYPGSGSFGHAWRKWQRQLWEVS